MSYNKIVEGGGQDCNKPREMTSELSDTQNELYFLIHRMSSNSREIVSKPPSLGLHAPHFGLQLKIFGFYIYKKSFLFK